MNENKNMVSNSIMNNSKTKFQDENVPVVISFYAGDEYYYRAAKMLRADCDRLGLEHSIDELTVPPDFDWSQICRLKATFYRTKLRELKRPILWIDVDSRLRYLPEALIGARFALA